MDLLIPLKDGRCSPVHDVSIFKSYIVHNKRHIENDTDSFQMCSSIYDKVNTDLIVLSIED